MLQPVARRKADMLEIHDKIPLRPLQRVSNPFAQPTRRNAVQHAVEFDE